MRVRLGIGVFKLGGLRRLLLEIYLSWLRMEGDGERVSFRG